MGWEGSVSVRCGPTGAVCVRVRPSVREEAQKQRLNESLRQRG